MELRSRSHLHFIQALKGGLLIKALNVTRGRPGLVFKKLTEIHETLDAKNGDLFPAMPPKDEFRGLLSDSDRVRAESRGKCTLQNVRIKTEPEASAFDSSDGTDGNDGRNSDLSGFGNMTLKQIKATCKKKKRKRSQSVELNKKLVTGSPIQQEYPMLQTDEKDYDLLAPLSNLKSKFSKKAKAKTKSKRIKNCVSTMSQSAILTIKSEHIPSEPELSQFNGHAPASGLDIKVEAPETGSSDFQSTISFVGDTSLAYKNQVGSCGAVPNELPVTPSECVSMIGLPITKESQICVVDEGYEGMEYAEPTPIQIVTTSEWDIVQEDDPEITGYQCLDFPLLEYNIEGYIVDSVHPDIFIEAISSAQDHNFDVHDTVSSDDERLCQINSETQVQMSDMAVDDIFQCMEPISRSDACQSEADTKAALPSNVEASDTSVSYSGLGSGSCSDACQSEADTKDALPTSIEASASSISDSGLGSGSCLVSVADDSPMAEEEKQYEMFACAVPERNLSLGSFSSEATDELTTVVNGGSPNLKQQRPPQRLFQTRKIISPASQEKLCKALKSIELHDENSRACNGNLCSGTQTYGTIGGVEGPDQIKGAKFSIKTQDKNEKISSLPKGISKASNVSKASQRFSTGCTSIQACSESAVAFSQRQMHDIESLATKLTNELTTMKEIAEERLQSEAYPATSLKYNANEVRMAIKNVTRVEASARRLLSMMSRDTSRFCKIMKLADNGSSASENVATKDKKITFADEAGEKLCHVKLFVNDMSSFSEAECEQKQEFLDK